MCSGKTGISLITAATAKIAFLGPAKGQKIKEGDAATCVLLGNLWVAMVVVAGRPWAGVCGWAPRVLFI